MKSRGFIFLIVLIFALEAVLTVFFLKKTGSVHQDSVAVNDCLKTIEENYGKEELYPTELEYSILDNDGNVVFKNGSNLSETISGAVKRSDTILDIMCDGELQGHIIFKNNTTEMIGNWQLKIAITIVVSTVCQAVLIVVYYIYLNKKIVEPFNKLSAFAERVAGGDLDVPLTLDKGHIFGEFTEAFDLMRTELKKSRAAEKAANDAKKEVVAKLSHDIKTPVASIKSASEFGYEISQDEKIKERFNSINFKADELTQLVDNLFNSSVQDATEIEVDPGENTSDSVYQAIKNADYLNKCADFTIPECRVFTDKLRLQQAFDNVFINSYKYAGTDIKVDAKLEDGYLKVTVRDFGPGVTEQEAAVIKEKYKRGANSEGKDGAGLGLYLTSYFLKSMDGDVFVTNEEPGLQVLFLIRTI